MGRSRKTTAKTPARAAKPPAPPLSPLERAARHRRDAISKTWAAIHPERAAAERGLKQARKAALASFGHKRHGTPETHAHVARGHAGALARLYQSGTLSADQLAWSAEIGTAYEQVTSDCRVRTMSMETRVDRSGQSGAWFEALSRVRLEVAYGGWRSSLGLGQLQLVLAIVADDVGLAAAARLSGMGKPRAKALLLAALNRWPEYWREACERIDPAELAAAQAGILS